MGRTNGVPKKGITGSAQRAVRKIHEQVSKSALMDALLDCAALRTECADEDGAALVQALRELLVPVLERRGDRVPPELRELAP